MLGPLRLERAYYHCELCEAGFCPRDRALGLEGGSLSPGVLRMAGLVGAMVSFEEGHELRTGVPVRKKELVDRPAKQPDGSSKTREVKLVTIWSAEGRDKEGTPVRDAGSISYSAAIESAAQKDTDATPSEFAARVEREATRRGFDRAARQAVLGDGAIWIWKPRRRALSPCGSDRRPLPRPSSTSRMCPSPSTAPALTSHSSGRANAHDELDAGDIDAIINALRLHSPKDDEAPQVHRLRRA